MIVRPRPNLLRLFFIMRGSVVPRIAPQIVGFAVYGALVVLLVRAADWHLDAIGLAPFALLGVALSIYLGFRNNAAYERWWDARKLWGQLIYEVRNLARAAQTACPSEPAVVRPLMMEVLAFCHLLRGELRKVDADGDAARFLGVDVLPPDWLRADRPDAAVRAMGRRLSDWRVERRIEPVDYRILDEHLSALVAIHAGCARIAGTPVPFAYTLLLHRSAYLFCALLPFGMVSLAGWWTPFFTAVIAYSFFGLDALSEELEDPFGLQAADLALDAMCRICEISIFDALDEEAPPLLQPDRFLLS